jgi:hypothetical protein
MINEITTGSHRRWGRLLLVAGLVLGLLSEQMVGLFIQDTWAYCMNQPPPFAIDIADSPRFSILALPLIVAYGVAFPVGFLLAARLLVRPRRRPVRLLVASLAGVLLLSAVASADLVYNVAPPNGNYLSGRCPHGRPPGWPNPLPMRGSPFRDFEHQG